MKRSLLTSIGILVFALVFLASTPLYAEKVRGVTDDIIKVGIIADLSGPFVAATVPIKNAISNYYKYLNDKGGVNGRKVKLVVEDDRYSIPPAISAFKKLVFKDKIFATFGPSQTGASVALFSKIKKHKLVTFPHNLSDKLGNPHKRYIFAAGASYADQITVIYDYIMKKTEKPRIAIVRFDLDYGKVGLAAAEKRAAYYNTKLVGDIILSPGALEATSQVMTLKRTKADYVILHGNPSMAVSILRDAKKLGLKTAFIGTLGCTEDTVVKMAGSAAKSFLGTHYFGSWYDVAPGIKRMREITSKHSQGSKPRTQFYTMGWSMVNIFTEGLNRAGRNLTSETFVDALETLRGFDTKGVCGPVTYTSTSHKPNQYSKFFRADVENGRIIAFTDWLKPVE